MTNEKACKSIGIPLGAAVHLSFSVFGSYLDKKFAHIQVRDQEAQQVLNVQGNGNIAPIFHLIGVAVNMGMNYGFDNICSSDESISSESVPDEENNGGIADTEVMGGDSYDNE